MTLDFFRIHHSELIEHYQYIEFNLEGIYAALCGQDFVSDLQTVEKDNVTRLVHRIQKMDPEHAVLTEEDCDEILNVNSKRNFYAHNCYVDMIFDAKTKAPKDQYLAELIEELSKAKTLRDDLYNKKMELFLDKEIARKVISD